MGLFKPDIPEYPEMSPEELGQQTREIMKALYDPQTTSMALEADSRIREQTLELGLRDIWGMTMGFGDQKGTLDLLKQITPEIGDVQAQALTKQREADIADIERLGGRATEALRASDPEMQKLLGQQGQVVDQLFGRAQGVTTQQQRTAEQQARSAGMARGRGYGEGTIAAEILGREGFQQQNRAEFLNAAQQRFGMLGSTAADPFQAILGRQGMAFSGAQQQQGTGMNAANVFSGFQTVDPNQATNIALQNQANKANYNANTYGAQASMTGNILGGAMGMFGSFGQGMFAGGCWVARECYGQDDPRWTLFRGWLFAEAPDWFANLYIKYGERFAKWVSDKPVIKWCIRSWMTRRIKKFWRI